MRKRLVVKDSNENLIGMTEGTQEELDAWIAKIEIRDDYTLSYEDIAESVDAQILTRRELIAKLKSTDYSKLTTIAALKTVLKDLIDSLTEG